MSDNSSRLSNSSRLCSLQNRELAPHVAAHQPTSLVSYMALLWYEALGTECLSATLSSANFILQGDAIDLLLHKDFG